MTKLDLNDPQACARYLTSTIDVGHRHALTMYYLFRGYTMESIAAELHYASTKAVASTVHRLAKRFQVRGRLGLAVYAASIFYYRAGYDDTWAEIGQQMTGQGALGGN